MNIKDKHCLPAFFSSTPLVFISLHLKLMMKEFQFPYRPFSFQQDIAICVDDINISYLQFDRRIAGIVHALMNQGIQKSKVGIVIDDHVDTYAAILAVWHTGSAYVPLHPAYPVERLTEIAEIAELAAVIVPGNNPFFADGFPFRQITTAMLPDKDMVGDPVALEDDDLAYILFTSGSTGIPKGVAIQAGNIRSFLRHNQALKFDFQPGDRFLQMFDLTFDLSVVSYLLPFLSGGTLYHVSLKSVKYMEIYRLLEEYSINYAILVPSVLSLLRPYFEDIELPALRHVGLSGEAVPVALTEEWMKCCPNAVFYNFYGPTEATIFCTNYIIPREGFESVNGIVSIGSPTLESDAIVVDEEMKPVIAGQKGELLIGGRQVTPGYVKNKDANQKAFATVAGKQYYRTGDIVICSTEGLYFYLGRKDHQVKIQGYRIELSEVEFQVSQLLGLSAAAVVVEEERVGSTISLFVKADVIPDDKVRATLKTKLPDYMIPSRFHFLDEFPLNNNGKLDRKTLQQWAYDKR